MEKVFGRVLFAVSFLLPTSCGVHTNGTKATDNSAIGAGQTVDAVAVCEAQGNGCAADADRKTALDDGSARASNLPAQKASVADERAERTTVQSNDDAPGDDSGKTDEGVAVGRADSAEIQSAENVDAADEITAGGITDDMFVKCEARIGKDGKFYTAQAVGPTIEEARENAVAEACSIPCAEELEEQGIADDELEKLIDDCAEACSDEGLVVAAICFREGISIYTEGGWNENGDPAPTNGSETPK